MLTSRDVPLKPWIHARWLIAAIDKLHIIEGFVQTGLK